MLKYNYPYLKDTVFLDEISKEKNITFYAKITVLNWNEQPITQLEGVINSASFSFDGKSSLRRTGNLTMSTRDDYNITETKNLISINKKIGIEIGYVNKTSKYLDFPIIWFPLGLYVITSASIEHNLTSLSISLQLKDKMCLLNGQCGGILPASIVFDNYLTIDENGQEVIQRPTIFQIIQELVNHYGNEQLGNIIISDLSTKVKQVMKWAGTTPLYFLTKQGEYRITINETQYRQLLKEKWYNIMGSPFLNGYDVGYIYTDFTYPGDLISNPGDSIVSVLDKIVGILGNYEYFYDLQGHFVFQQIKNFLNNSQTQDFLVNENIGTIVVPNYIANFYKYGSPLAEDYIIDNSYGKDGYAFNNGVLINSYNNAPNYQGVKNDFVVWGRRKDTEGRETPIRYHLVIDQKPKTGLTSYEVILYKDQEDGLTKCAAPLRFTKRSVFPPTGIYGKFYLDQETNQIYIWKNKTYILTSYRIITVYSSDWRTQLYLEGVQAQALGTATNYYYTQLANEWPKLYEIVPGEKGYTDAMRQDVKEHMELIDYFLDFIDTGTAIGELSVNNIGRRTQVLNKDGDINCVFEPQIPDFILVSNGASQAEEMTAMRQEAQERGQAWLAVPASIYNKLVAGGYLYSCYQMIRQLLHTYVGYNETVTLNCVPLYFLQPNTRIYIKDIDSNIDGNYMINSISFSLDAGSLMNITCTRALQKI